jgi:hypothetical protein
MDIRNKIHKLYRSLNQEYRDSVNRLNNSKGKIENIVFLQEQADDLLEQINWVKKAFLANGEKIDESEGKQ